MEQECHQGNHSLILISVTPNNMGESVVRWCNYCGAIVIDLDYDGCIDPGKILSIQFPELAKRYFNGK